MAEVVWKENRESKNENMEVDGKYLHWKSECNDPLQHKNNLRVYQHNAMQILPFAHIVRILILDFCFIHSIYKIKEAHCFWASECSSVFGETNEFGLFSESSSWHVDSVLSDKTLASSGNSASSRVLTEFSWMTVQLFLHFF